jgi:TPR repeat protein
MKSKFRLYCGAAASVLAISLAATDGVAAAGAGSVAREDDALAMIQMAARFENAEGVARNFQHAANLYCRAARSGRAEAQYHLGWMYANGRGVTRDDGVAAELFALAAAQGHEQAKRMLLYVRPKSPAVLPACMSVAEWMPDLKLSRELAAAENVRVAGDAQQDAPAAMPVRAALRTAR